MSHSSKPDMSKHSKVINFGSKADADNYVRAGWELINTHAEQGPSGRGQTVIVYRVGWPLGAGEPVEPPLEGDPMKFDAGPYTN